MNTGPMGKGVTRYFTVESGGRPVIWTVEGGSESGGTVITPFNKFTGRLTVGNNESSMLLIVKALSVEEDNAVLGTARVKVKVWRELTAGLEGLITNKASGWKWFAVSVGNEGASFGINVLAYGEGVGPGKGRWVVGGGSDDVLTTTNYNYPVMAYSDNDGDSWTEIHTNPALLYEETPECLIYDGPAGNKKFVLSTQKNSVFWSEDGIKWIRVSNAVPGDAPPDSTHYLWQVLYGDIDRADGGQGIYLVRGERGKYSWSYDGKTWSKQYGTFIGEECTSMDLQYGTGFIGGKRVKMFFGAGYEYAPFHYIYTYSLDGETWELLEEGKVDALQFVPLPPAGANQRILWWLDEADTSLLDFAPDTTIYEYKSQTGTIKEGPGVSSHAEFVAYGNDKYMAVGLGRRLAIGYADVFKK